MFQTTNQVMSCHGSLVLDYIGQLACIHVHQFHQELHCVIYDAQPCDADVWQELWPLVGGICMH